MTVSSGDFGSLRNGLKPEPQHFWFLEDPLIWGVSAPEEISNSMLSVELLSGALEIWSIGELPSSSILSVSTTRSASSSYFRVFLLVCKTMGFGSSDFARPP